LLNALLAISRCATLEEALEPLLTAALDVTRMEGGGVYWVEGEVAVLRCHRGLPEAFIREVTRMSLTPPPVRVLLDQREPIEVGEISPRMRELLLRHGIRHAFSFPLRAQGILFGFLNVGSTRAQVPEKEDLQALWILVKEIESLFFRLYSEKALRESEQRYRTLWECALDGILLHDLLVSPQKGHFVDANDCLCRILGYTRAEILTLTVLDIVAEEEKKAIAELAARVRRAGKLSFETTLVTKDGRRVPVEVNSNVVQLGERRVALAIIRDVTERQRATAALRESEERFNAFMDHSPAIAWMRDEQGRYVYLSRTYINRSGKEPEECLGKTAFDLWPREIAEGFWKLDQEVLRTGRPAEVMEEIPLPAGGRSYWWNVKFPFQDASGRRFVGGIGVDITERKRMEAMLQQAKERLEEQVEARTSELNHTVDQLQSALQELERHAEQLQKITLEVVQAEDRERRRLAEFLHDDLQQTLAAAKFHLGLLGGRIGDDPPGREILEQIKQMLKEAIEQSRSLSHELGPPALYQSDLGAVFEWLAGQMESKHGLAVQVEIRDQATSQSEPVRSFLFRTAQELLFNAAKHAQVREAKLRLQRVREELWLTVSDRGRGFDPASLTQSAGFGLATIRERIELLGGRLTIKSAPGQGSIFFITVPDVAV